MLRDIWNRNCRGFLTILLLNIAVSLAGGILIVMLVPIPGLLDVSTGTVSALTLLMLPLQGLSPTAQRLKAGFAKAYGCNATDTERHNMVQNEGKWDVPPEVQEKVVHANCANAVDEDDVSDLKFVSVTNRHYLMIKRMLDIILALLALIGIATPMLVVFLMVYIDDPGSVIFSQYRVGQGGRRFKLYKVRTMRQDTPKYMSTSEVDDPNRYITRVGRILRRLSIDELPQLFNVLKGDMSIVGPRPLISDEYEIHELRMKLGVYGIRPGLTGVAQIHGRDTVTPADKVRWDVRYLEKLSFGTDVKIVLLTLPKLISGNGVAEGFKHSTR